MNYYDNPAVWLAYYRQQVAQNGHGLDGFRGLPFQRGAGLGSFFKSLFSMAIPVLKQAARSTAKRVGKQALTAIGQVASDVTSGKGLKQSLVARGKEAASNVLKGTAEDITQSGSGLGVRPLKTTVRLPITRTAIATAGIKRKVKPKRGSVTKRRRLVKSDIFSL